MDKYEKLYNEALERFKSFKEKYYTKDTNLGDVIFDKNGEMQKDFNGIFPELAESEDERIRKWILEKVQEYADSGIPCSNEIQMANKTIAWIEKQKEQKPNVEICPHSIKSKSYKENGYPIEDCVQKPAEWGDKDEEMRNIIIAIFEVNHPNGFFKANELGTTDMRGVHTEEIISWLKSLRPVSKESLQSHWKPSEEQMEAFRSYIKDFQEKAEAAVGGWNNFDVMIRLFEQLKKLM